MTTCRRTKIVCTIGPASNSPAVLKQLIEAGMNVARMNFSHGSHEEHAGNLAAIRQAARELGTRVAVLQDLSGPKMRIGKFAAGSIQLVPGEKFVLTTRAVEGDEKIVSMNTPEIVESVDKGDRILLADGELELRVLQATATDVECEIVAGGELRSNKGISTPGVKLKKTVPTDKDLADLEFGLSQGVDWIAQSFVRSVNEVRALKKIIREKGFNVPVMVKLEKKEALDDLDAIIQQADGIMVARGDLAMEIGLKQIPIAQKEIIHKAGLYGKPDITATQMLESMIVNPRPTRAEVTDIANAILDGTDAVMLSGETAVGQYPVDAVRMMAEVAHVAEESINYIKHFKDRPLNPRGTVEDAIAHAACQTAIEIGAKVIICCTKTGQTARLISRYRPHAPIAVVSPNENTLQLSVLYWGACQFKVDMAKDTDTVIAKAKELVLKSNLAQAGDRVVVVAGIPVDQTTSTNMLKADVL